MLCQSTQAVSLLKEIDMTWLSVTIAVLALVFVLWANGIKYKGLQTQEYLPSKIISFVVILGLLAVMVWLVYALFK
jgi:hypothetical protein